MTMNDYIAMLTDHPQLLAHAKELEVKELRSFLWKKILQLYGLDYADTIIEVSAYYSSSQFLLELENVLESIFPQVYKVPVEKMPHKIIFVCEPAGDDEDVIVVASWFAEKPDPAS
jgi:hypothetical protein